jgi:diguanylate cyclase (GGDEF)-like protein
VEIELARARRYQHPTSLIMIDVDLFKLVNDRFGHTTGDLVLKETCAVIRKAVRESDILGRYGGEEFVLLLPETALERAVEVAERLRLLLQNHSVKVGDQEISISISAGIASLGEACKDADGLFRCADLAMYHAKQAGRNQVYAASELPDNKSLL